MSLTCKFAYTLNRSIHLPCNLQNMEARDRNRNPRNVNEPKKDPSATAVIGQPSVAKIPSAKSGPVPAQPLTQFQKNLHSIFTVLFCESQKRHLRHEGRKGSVSGFTFKYGNGQVKSYYAVNLYYQMFVGAVGGVTCGIETSFFHQEAAGKSMSMISKWPGVQNMLRNTGVVGSMTARAITAAILFDLLDKNMEEYRQRKGWINFASAGCVSGAIFGLAGGLRGSLYGSLGFGAFAAMAGFFDDSLKRF